MRDYVHVFVNMDRDQDGLLSIDDFKRCFDKNITRQKMQELFWV